MKPLLLKMINFLSYEDEEFDFSQITNATITGRNGAGKSSFCTDAITWVLFGKGSRGSEKDSGNYISTGANCCTVELTFSLNRDSVYKVIRSVRSNKGNRMALNLFVLDKDGTEIPLTCSNLSNTQNKIESLLKMTYRTFCASSMIFQGKADEFTNGMTNSERKEALINILNIGEWEKVEKRAKANLSALNKELHEKQIQRDVQNNIISNKADYEAKRKLALKELKNIIENKKIHEKNIEKNQKVIYQRDETNKSAMMINTEISDIEARISRSNNDIKVQQNIIERNTQNIKKNNDKIAEQQEILKRQKEIDEAVEQEKILTKAVNGLWQKQQEYNDAVAELNRIANEGKIWKAALEKDIQVYESRIADAQKQAKALDSVPCASNKELSSSCMFLKMARKAKESIEKLTEEKEARIKEINPFTKQWKDKKEVVNSMSVNLDDMENKQAELRRIQTVSRLKPLLDSAADNITLLLGNNEDLEERIKEAKVRIDEIREQLVKDKESLKTLNEKSAAIQKALSSYSEIYIANEQAKTALETLEKQEISYHNEIGSCDTLLKQVSAAEDTLKIIEKEIAKISKDVADTEMLIEACGKNAGVPALIVENAVPELEAECNAILENMMDGRLQIRLDTQVETNKGTKLEVFRITILDDGYERRYETYSGAEKFVVDLALRIAMSKFLCKRNGANVSLFVLDEGVSCADESNRDEIIKAIRSITSEFDIVLFVTHIEELKDALDQRIEVTKTSLGSHIKVR